MKYIFAIVITFATVACAQHEKNSYVLIKNATIIPMTGDKKEFIGSILLKDSVIWKVGYFSAADIPANTTIIDASGKYVMPGLWDTHVHLFKITRKSIPELLKYGITSVRDMGGDTDTIKQIIKDIRTGKIKGPRIIFCGPIFENPWFMDWFLKNRGLETENIFRTRVNLKDKNDAQRLVDSVANLGVDFIKVRYFKDPETYWALARAVRKRGLKLYGHSPDGIDQTLVPDSGQVTFEHGWYPSLAGLDDQKVEAIIKKFRDNNCVLVPTINIWDKTGFTSYSKIDSLINGPVGIRDPRIDSLPKELLNEWKVQLADRKRNGNLKGWKKDALNSMMQETSRMFRQGITIMPGSDVTSPNLFPGESLHEELSLFVNGVGMTPYEALKSATEIPGEYFRSGETGTIREGKLADLIILARNPLADLKNLSTINYVIKNGEVVFRQR